MAKLSVLRNQSTGFSAAEEVLIAKMLGSMNAPISGFVNVLQGTIRNVVYALEAVRKQKESA